MNTPTTQTPEEIEAAKAAAAAKKAEEKAAREAKKAAEKAEREAKKAAEKAAKAEAEKAKLEAKEAEKAAKAAAKEEAKKAALAAKEASRQPEQNGVRRPKPDTLCGKAWAIFDAVSQKNGAPASIGESMISAREQGLNEANVRCEYARWRKFFGISGRIEDPTKPKPEPKPAAETTAPAEPATTAEG